MFGDDEPWMGELPSIRLEHATLFSGEMIDRLVNARMSFAVITHSIFLFAEFQSYERNLSSRQFEIAYPIRSLYERVRFTALSSDSPTTAWAEADDVFVSVQAAVCRRSHTGADIGQAEAVTVPQALLLYTGRAGALVPMEGLGMIRPGYEASFVVLDRDVFTVHANELDRVRVIQTWIRGDLAYTA
jgi:predicted amidohydrolase YtcJ